MKFSISISITTCIFLLTSCGAPTLSPTPALPTPTPALAPAIVPTLLPTLIPTLTPKVTVTQRPVSLPLSERGPFQVGILRNLSFEDSSRGDRKVAITVWYPAIQPSDSTGSAPISDAAPDPAGGPYPLILCSSKVGSIFGPHLTSYGFIVVGINGQDSASHWGKWLTDYPLDIVFALNQIAAHPPEGLAGYMDTEQAGAMGYSFDGYTSLALSGARIDPEFYLTQCADSTEMNPAPPAGWVDYNCNLTGGWDAFVANASASITTSKDEMWQPITDERIRAVMPMAPEGAWLFGERGLAAADRPTLIIGATEDEINIYNLEAVYIFEHLGTPDRAMISFIGEGHRMVYSADPVARMEHFATAFFGYHLQRRDDYAKYFSEDFVAQYDDLAWGVYEE